MGSGGADAWRPCEDLAKEALSFVTFHDPSEAQATWFKGRGSRALPHQARGHRGD